MQRDANPKIVVSQQGGHDLRVPGDSPQPPAANEVLFGSWSLTAVYRMLPQRTLLVAAVNMTIGGKPQPPLDGAATLAREALSDAGLQWPGYERGPAPRPRSQRDMPEMTEIVLDYLGNVITVKDPQGSSGSVSYLSGRSRPGSRQVTGAWGRWRMWPR